MENKKPLHQQKCAPVHCYDKKPPFFFAIYFYASLLIIYPTDKDKEYSSIKIICISNSRRTIGRNVTC